MASWLEEIERRESAARERVEQIRAAMWSSAEEPGEDVRGGAAAKEEYGVGSQIGVQLVLAAPRHPPVTS
ncbi:hypothetical protein ACIPSA_36540 [Streptomyces sp. NPDC086549]|uniref:hypothetical protein n=1 Tax=Streptomyces sp. NPDC086549 TaxID=3365752 RepID=UPI0037FBA3A2